MASISGGHFSFSGGHEQVGSGHGGDAGHLGLASIADVHSTVAGGGDTVGGGADSVSSGFDTVNSPDQGAGLAGQLQGGSDVVATQSQDGGNTIMHLNDGSSITIVGTSNVDGLFHH